MTAFATPDDLESRWRPLTPAERATADELLSDASAILRAECSGIDARIDDGRLDPAVPRMVVCAMVKRAMIAGDMAAGVSSHQQTAGPFSQSLSFVNPTGDLYLTKAERKRIGCGGQKAFTIDTAPPRSTLHESWCATQTGASFCTCGSALGGI